MKRTTTAKRTSSRHQAATRPGEPAAAAAGQAGSSELLAWYETSGRHGLPWRLTRDPYAVVVSEVMLQQTQVARVRPYYEAWLARWPDFPSLAAATPADAIREWAGLGYNRRAVNLHRLAVEVVVRQGGNLPHGERELLRLPGIGPYTAKAVRSFARDERVAVVDTNIGRLIARVQLGVANSREATPVALRQAAEQSLPVERTRDHNLALMDLGALVCVPRAPACGSCPLAASCAWRAAGYPPGERGPAPSPRFQDTARFARGRIVEALRTVESLSRAELAAALPLEHRDRMPAYVAALERDGVIERRDDGTWSLPGLVQGSRSMASPKL